MADDIPAVVRRAVELRDKGACRRCGRRRHHLHHINFGGDTVGMGGRRAHEDKSIVSLCQDCHHAVHENKSYWQEWLLKAIKIPGCTALQLIRQDARRRQVLPKPTKEF